MRLARFIFCLIFCASLTLPVPADEGTVVVAKTGHRPMLLWDATGMVTTIVSMKEPRPAALRRLESNAMQILGKRAPALKNASSLTIRAVYQKIGAVSPVYGTATFEGVERLFELSAPYAAARTRATQLAKSLAHGTIPPGVRLNVTGQLPPP